MRLKQIPAESEAVAWLNLSPLPIVQWGVKGGGGLNKRSPWDQLQSWLILITPAEINREGSEWRRCEPHTRPGPPPASPFFISQMEQRREEVTKARTWRVIRKGPNVPHWPPALWPRPDRARGPSSGWRKGLRTDVGLWYGHGCVPFFAGVYF